jgi:hypothetical protein
LHAPSPHTGGALQLWPQTLCTSFTQALSQLLLQQNESTWQICATHGSQLLVRATPVTHLSWAQAGQAPQSEAQLEQVSAPLHAPSPHVGQGPQSLAQLEQVSPPLQTESPQVGFPPQLWPQTVCTSFTQALSQLLLQQ